MMQTLEEGFVKMSLSQINRYQLAELFVVVAQLVTTVI
jgi:hypothetical protein